MDAQAAARRWAATWTAAWQAHDVEAVVALYAEDCVHRSTPFRPPHRGRQAVRDYVAQAFADEQRIDDVRFDPPVVQGDRACARRLRRRKPRVRGHADDSRAGAPLSATPRAALPAEKSCRTRARRLNAVRHGPV